MRARIKLCFGTELQKGLGTFLEPTRSIVFQVDTHNGIESFSFLLFICFYFHIASTPMPLWYKGSVQTFEIAMLWVQFVTQQF